MKTLEKLFVFFVLLFILAINPFFSKNPEDFLVPSKKFHTIDWSIRFWNYISQVEKVDILIIGNSRTMYGIRPNDLKESILKKTGSKMNVHSLATQGGYFLFYRHLFEKMLKENHLPKHVIFGVSPRDFNAKQMDADIPFKHLTQSSAYLANFTDTMNRLEVYVRDLYASILPVLFYRADVYNMIFNSTKFPNGSFSEASKAWLNYKNQIENIRGFSIEHYNKILGKNLIGQEALFNAEIHNKYADQVSRWLVDDLEQKKRWQPSDGFEIDHSMDSESYKLFSYLNANNIKVTFITVPAIKLEEQENNYLNYKKFLDHLFSLKERFKNIDRIFDLNQGFHHKFIDTKYFFDGGEHANASAARLFSEDLVEHLY